MCACVLISKYSGARGFPPPHLSPLRVYCRLDSTLLSLLVTTFFFSLKTILLLMSREEATTSTKGRGVHKIMGFKFAEGKDWHERGGGRLFVSGGSSIFMPVHGCSPQPKHLKYADVKFSKKDLVYRL